MATEPGTSAGLAACAATMMPTLPSEGPVSLPITKLKATSTFGDDFSFARRLRRGSTRATAARRLPSCWRGWRRGTTWRFCACEGKMRDRWTTSFLERCAHVEESSFHWHDPAGCAARDGRPVRYGAFPLGDRLS